MSLMPEVLVRGEFGVDALRLKHDADLAAHGWRHLCRIAAHD